MHIYITWCMKPPFSHPDFYLAKYCFFSCIVMWSCYFLSFEWMQFPHAVNNTKVITSPLRITIIKPSVVCWVICGTHCYWRQKEWECAEVEQWLSRIIVLLIGKATLDHRGISLKMRAAAGNIKGARLRICTHLTSLYSASCWNHTTLLLDMLWEWGYFI